MVGGVAVINVSAATETEMKEKKARVEDAMHATRAAVEEGIVPGDGVAYLRCLHALEKLEVSGGEKFGVDLVRRALEEPLRWIVANGGWKAPSSSTKCARARPHSASTRRAASTRTCSRPGVIDPTKVTRFALQNASSVASLTLTTEAIVAEKPRDKDEGGAGAHGMSETRRCR